MTLSRNLLYIAGDTHGHADVVRNHVARAASLGAARVMVVGDFGLWPGNEGINFLDLVNEAAMKHRVDVYALPGNHEDHDQWDWWVNSTMPKLDGFTFIRSRILLSPRVHSWTWEKKRFWIAGGAYSIDRRWRREGFDWWPNEVLTEQEVLDIEKYKGPAVDYLFTHDCSDYTEFPFHLVPDPDSQAHRKKIDRVIAAVRPDMHWHGHMHCPVEWVNTRSHGLINTAFGTCDVDYNGASTLTFSMDCDYEVKAHGLLNIKTGSFQWSAQGFQ